MLARGALPAELRRLREALLPQLGPAAELVAFLNDYFTRMCEPVLAERGVIDKFIGDAIMAFFGAPIATADHGCAAVRAALRALEVSEEIAAENAARGAPPTQTRIGIHTGQAVVGNMGSAERFDYTAIGDTVNLASRLESANKHLGTATLLGERTAKLAEAEFLLRPIARLKVVGRDTPEPVFELLCPKAQATPEAQAAAARSAVVVEAFAAGDFARCRGLAEKAKAQEPGAKWADLYLAACDAHLADPALAHDGSLALEKK